jgi:choline dehydrogenase-like flavoprotein
MSESLRCDAVVIGRARRARVAAAPAEAGFDVVVLEAGARFETRDFAGTRASDRPADDREQRDSGVEAYAGACVGGSTVVNDALCWGRCPILDG